MIKRRIYINWERIQKATFGEVVETCCQTRIAFSHSHIISYNIGLSLYYIPGDLAGK